ncbi:MAG TPA: hypothetical protein VK966_01320, partial [Longimicrobiales bacterium]|nr:hypothetical protein [Longimicrobiales bacterium]
MSHAAKAYRVQVFERGSTSTVDFTLSLSDLHEIPTVGGAGVRPLQGKTISEPYTVYALDTAGVITSRFGEDARPAMLGRMIRVQQQTDGGAWTTLNTGRCSNLGEPSGPGLYAIEVSDERWLERRADIFGSTTTVQLHPFGPTEAFGPYPWRVDAGGTDDGW